MVGTVASLEAANLHQQFSVALSPGVGRVVLSPGRRPVVGSGDQVVPVALRSATAMPGLSPVLHRFFSSIEGWEVDGLPVGEYDAEIEGQTFRIQVVDGNVAILE